MSQEKVLLSDDRDGVRTLTLNRPDRKNAINAQLWIEPADAVAPAQSKALLNDGANSTLREALANEARAQPGNFATADSIEAYAAFAEKRDPAFTGRWAVPRSEWQDA